MVNTKSERHIEGVVKCSEKMEQKRVSLEHFALGILMVLTGISASLTYVEGREL